MNAPITIGSFIARVHDFLRLADERAPAAKKAGAEGMPVQVMWR